MLCVKYGYSYRALVLIFLVVGLVKEIRGCHICECDPSGALSSCQNGHCTPHHQYLNQPTKCDITNRKCCRMMCQGEGSMCMPDTKQCMEGHTEANNNGCIKGFKCCVLT